MRCFRYGAPLRTKSHCTLRRGASPDKITLYFVWATSLFRQPQITCTRSQLARRRVDIRPRAMHTSTSPQSVLTPPPAEGTAVNAGIGRGALQRRRSSESFDDRPRPVMEWGQRDGANVAKSEPVTPLLRPAEYRPSADTVCAALAGCALEPILSHAERAPQHAGSSVDATAPNMVIEHLRLSMEKLLETNARLVSTNAELVQRLKEEKRCRRPSKAAMTIQAIQVQAVEQDLLWHRAERGREVWARACRTTMAQGVDDEDVDAASVSPTSTRRSAYRSTRRTVLAAPPTVDPVLAGGR